jgi:homoserine O-acetyltransferase
MQLPIEDGVGTRTPSRVCHRLAPIAYDAHHNLVNQSTSTTRPPCPPYLVTATQIAHFDEPLDLECGRTLASIDVAYETYGALNADRSNAVLICHAWTGDAHVAGYAPGENPEDAKTKAGWWDLYVGPGKAIDTDRYFVICTNLLGGCKGTTGPASTDPATGQPYGPTFPIVTIGDMVVAQKRLVDRLGIKRLLCVTGGSMGGMQALEWAVRYPDSVFGAIPIATTPMLGAQALAFDAVGRSAIQRDPEFHDGEYAKHNTKPRAGLAVARMLGHITFLSEEKMHEKFGRTLRHGDELRYDLASQFSVETYLDYQGQKFVDRFDANSYLYLTRAMDLFDLGAGRGGVDAALARTKAQFCVISFSHDWLFTSEQSKAIVRALAEADRTVTYLDVVSNYGHDAFLLPSDHQERAIRGFLRRLEDDWHNQKKADPAAERSATPWTRSGDAISNASAISWQTAGPSWTSVAAMGRIP